MANPTRVLLLSALLSALLSTSCAPSVAISPGEAERLARAPAIPVLQVRTRAPWVDCPNDEGMKIWEYPGTWRSAPEAPVRLASAGSALPIVRASGTWDTFQDQWTRTLQTPPVDPAAVTAAYLIDRVRDAPRPIPLAERGETIASVDRAELTRRFGASPVLIVEAPRFVLVGCFISYQPWFDARATLLRPETGEVLWRASCGGTYPGPTPYPLTRDQLEANGRLLYASRIGERAEICATKMAASLAGAPPEPAAPAAPATR
jgi:hypothetical protein